MITLPGKAISYILTPDGQHTDFQCKICKRPICSNKGKYMVGLFIVEAAGQTFKYLLGNDPPITCCGEEKIIPKIFDTPTEATDACIQMREHINVHGTTDGLKLLAIVSVPKQQLGWAHCSFLLASLALSLGRFIYLTLITMNLPTRAEAHILLEQYVKDDYQRYHAKMVAIAMDGYATLFNENRDLWYITGLLHDIDFEQHPTTHPKNSLDWFADWKYPADMIHAVEAHAYSYNGFTTLPQTKLAAALMACDEMSGIFYAYKKN